MHKRIGKILLTVLSVIFLSSTMAQAADKVLSLVADGTTTDDTITATSGSEFAVDVLVNDESVIAGASFTVTYDTANLLLLRVESTFFDTFVNQAIPEGELDPEGGVTVDNNNGDPTDDHYISPIVYNGITTGSMLAAARTLNETGGNKKLFTLYFEFIGSEANLPQDFLLSIVQSEIYNPDAGYGDVSNPTVKIPIPFLVGIGTDPTPYPEHNVPTRNGCTVTVNASFVDTENNGVGDGIDDNWEIANRPDGVAADDPNVLNYFTADGDYDKDGYSDYQEYLNFINGETEYDPTVKNAAGGTGYVPQGFIALPAINFLLLGN